MEAVKGLYAAVLVALLAGCHFDKLFNGGGPPLSHGTPVGLLFSASPGQPQPRAGQAISPPIRVAVVDSVGTPVAGADSLITIALGANPGTATLGGTSTVRAHDGMTTFANLTIDKAANGYTLTASGTGLTPDTTKAFDVMPPPPTTGSVTVTTSTGGPPDPDGYSVAVDAGATQPIGTLDSVTFNGLAAGSHAVTLTGLAANCTASGGTTRNVTVTAGDTARVAFAVNCSATTGNLTVSTTTGGPGTDPDGYTATVDGVPKAIPTNGSVTYNGVPEGDRTVGLTGVASNCTVSGQNPRTVTVTAGGTQQTNFSVTCTAPANQPPIAAFTTPSCNQLSCSFTSTSSDPDGTITSQQWNFGDNATGSGANPSHTYGAAGTYTVTLTVTDNGGAQDVVTHDVTVTSAPPQQSPVVIAGADQSSLLGGVTLNGASFSDADHDGPWTVTINWGDGTTPDTFTAAEGSIPGSHTYSTLSGTFTVTITVVDSHGNFGSATKTIHVGV